jgi:hypothetical protein
MSHKSASLLSVKAKTKHQTTITKAILSAIRILGAPEEGQDEGQAPAVSSDEGTVETESSVRRSSRQREAAATMNIGSTKGQSYVQKKKVVVKEDHNQEAMDPELEVHHNLFIQSKSKKIKEDFFLVG